MPKNNSFNKEFHSYIGIDETGVGDYFTPVVSVACYIPSKEVQEALINLGVCDSKKLSDHHIQTLAPQIMKMVKWSKNVLTQNGYNNLIKNSINNNEVKTLIHLNSLNNLNNTFSIDELPNVIIDQYCASEQVFQKHINKLTSIPWLQFHRPLNKIFLQQKAETIALPVATASIIARYILILHMEKQSKKYDFPFMLGCSSKIIDQGVELAKKIGIDNFKDIAKTSFKTTQKIIEKLQQESSKDKN
ncbi:ribonuclease HIII [Metamycoplasma hyosynoviae]|uniref:ribonuclease HIII n=1 Tax=Metamycoplasma hyosynoviae TaxID=29559 RepID=UPI0020C89ECD|nr:ribonuclease HIII [Metamycoplasma hyosynoviae]MDC8918032.1 ribonuclease HIII [Metamycoplasma hyosynoviae]MDC8962758.1 ribonuclease HIII [Metamycoplasma hyosynoviae]MDD1358791.1 ribonuclease HIII [Metamycoplasma hyosynoviae]MDD1361666.1 ribonuclease HIII [Metamycoplasma hyosynoviae]MDD1371838.1 ribonuclease HIII [Metamycoplasma hyosynoviae]